jgi:dihydroneopterin aldolase
VVDCSDGGGAAVAVDRIVLSGIEIYAHGGVSEAERQVGQRYEVDVELLLDLETAGRTDMLEDTVSYADVHDSVVHSLRERPFRLVEHAASRLAECLLERYAVDAVTVRLRKLHPPVDGVVASAGVEITRSRR